MTITHGELIQKNQQGNSPKNTCVGNPMKFIGLHDVLIGGYTLSLPEIFEKSIKMYSKLGIFNGFTREFITQCISLPESGYQLTIDDIRKYVMFCKSTNHGVLMSLHTLPVTEDKIYKNWGNDLDPEFVRLSAESTLYEVISIYKETFLKDLVDDWDGFTKFNLCYTNSLISIENHFDYMVEYGRSLLKSVVDDESIETIYEQTIDQIQNVLDAYPILITTEDVAKAFGRMKEFLSIGPEICVSSKSTKFTNLEIFIYYLVSLQVLFVEDSIFSKLLGLFDYTRYAAFCSN